MASHFWHNFSNGKKDVFGYYYFGNNGEIHRAGGSRDFNEDETKKEESEGWGTNDIINVIVDCIAWNITFEKNGKKIGKALGIEENDVYFLALALCTCEGVSFEVADA